MGVGTCYSCPVMRSPGAQVTKVGGEVAEYLFGDESLFYSDVESTGATDYDVVLMRIAKRRAELFTLLKG